MMMKWLCGLLAFVLVSASAQSAVVLKKITYTNGQENLEGYVARDNADNARRPVVLVAHERGGRSDEARARCQQIAKLGYVVLTTDLYGDGDEPETLKEMMKKSGLESADRKVARDRAVAALKFAQALPNVDAKHINGVGYGIGGSVLIELARTGTEEILDVLAIHSPILPRLESDKNPITAGIMLAYGEKDPLIPASAVASFEKELKEFKVEYEFYHYKDVAHDFTNPKAGHNLASGAAFDTEADMKVWNEIKDYLSESLPLKEAIQARGKVQPKPAEVKNVPQKAIDVLKYIDANGEAMEGYEGGRNFGNFEGHLPKTDRSGRRIRYQEWDVNPHRPGVNRGAERMITGSDGSAYYTEDHYQTFRKIR